MYIKPRLLFVVNTDYAFISHRLEIGLEALKEDYEVHIASQQTGCRETLENYGFIVHPLTLDRRSTGLFSNVRTFIEMMRLFRRIQPDIIHLVTIKPVLLGGLAARLVKIPHIVAAIPGLGFIFIARGIKARVRRWFVNWLYRLVLYKSDIQMIFQNKDDRTYLQKLCQIDEDNITLIRGSGVNLNHYPATPIPKGIPIVLFAARLLVDKGIREFVHAAQLLHAQGCNARFVLVGKPDPGNPATIGAQELQEWTEEKQIEYWGQCTDMGAIYAQASIVVLPSYREGLPKTLVEAAACGRPIITTDVPGCRDAIEPNTTGFLIPPRDSQALAQAIQHLLNNPELQTKMGQAGREMAQKNFDIKHVVRAHLNVYERAPLQKSIL